MQCSCFRLGRREIPKFFYHIVGLFSGNFSRVLEYFSSGDCPLFGIVSDTLVYLYLILFGIVSDTLYYLHLIYLKMAVCGDFGFQDS